MEKIYTFLILLICLSWISCSDDNKRDFDVAIDENMFSFTPVEGGAVMHYSLQDRRINKVKVEYSDEYGNSIYKVADYAVDTLVLDGFNQEHKNVPVRVSFLDKNEHESQVLEFTFNTLMSTLYTFFENVDVRSYWSGFQVVYNLKGRAEGSASVYFVGINPTTKLRDTIFLENFRLIQGENVMAYSIAESQRQDSYTVMITTEDDQQRIARKKVWTGVKGVDRVLIPNTNFELLDPFEKSREEEKPTGVRFYPGGYSKKFLFDGDVKGTQSANYYTLGYATPPFTFFAGPDALNRTDNDVYFVLDIKQPSIVGEMRFYMRIEDGYAKNNDFGQMYYSKLPCNIKIYAWIGSGDYDPINNPGTSEDWKQVGNFEQDPNTAESERWYVNAEGKTVSVKTKAELDLVDPIYLSIPFPFEEKEYRFFKLQFNETYEPISGSASHVNSSNNVTFHELEVYGQK